MSIKLIGIDIDGTLLNSRKELTPATFDALQAAADRGIQVVISTGRLLSEFPDLVEQLPMMRYTVTCTGTQVIDLHTGRDIFRRAMTADELRYLYGRFRDFDCMFQVFDDHDGRIHNDAGQLARAEDYTIPELARLIRDTHAAEADLPGYIAAYRGLTNKIHMFFPSPEARDEAWKATADIPYAMMASTVNDLEVMPLGVAKGLGLQKLAEHLGIDRSQVMAIGDGGNDVDMLTYAGLGVAMANGSDEAKAAADHVLSCTNDQDGVAKAIWAILRGEDLP